MRTYMHMYIHTCVHTHTHWAWPSSPLVDHGHAPAYSLPAVWAEASATVLAFYCHANISCWWSDTFRSSWTDPPHPHAPHPHTPHPHAANRSDRCRRPLSVRPWSGRHPGLHLWPAHMFTHDNHIKDVSINVNKIVVCFQKLSSASNNCRLLQGFTQLKVLLLPVLVKMGWRMPVYGFEWLVGPMLCSFL